MPEKQMNNEHELDQHLLRLESIVSKLEDNSDDLLPTDVMFELGTVDNPGWTVSVPLLQDERSSIATRSRFPLLRNYQEDVWLCVVLSKETFSEEMNVVMQVQGSADKNNLYALLETIALILTDPDADLAKLPLQFDATRATSPIEQWYARHCDEVWEHEFGVSLRASGDSTTKGWFSFTNDKELLERALTMCSEHTPYRWSVDYTEIPCIYTVGSTSFVLDALERVLGNEEWWLANDNGYRVD